MDKNCEVCSTGDTLLMNQGIGSVLTKAFGGEPGKYPRIAKHHVRQSGGKMKWMCDECWKFNKHMIKKYGVKK